jgi:uncharacterized protein with NRDE domain
MVSGKTAEEESGMCLILFAINSHPVYKLIFAANRDEFYERPSAPASFWGDAPDLLAGRDLRAGGTWLGITREGKIAAITNYRDPGAMKNHAPSRGMLVTNYLLGGKGPVEYLESLQQDAGKYNGFNLLVGGPDTLYWYSNCGKGIHAVSSGVHGLSNHLLDTSWPKVCRGKASLARLISAEGSPSPEALFDMLRDRRIAHDEALPSTGVGIEMERLLSPLFIKISDYGTRSSTVFCIDRKDRVWFMERTFNSGLDQPDTREFRFSLIR